ncbi:Tropomodulin [Oesophagostomum dentatum]|uniref:Tropomodulin n=1 Tax=Oesophagostomum dentatum TaxID=61180 RepID=A0A0B1TBB8_OESDE|nr:Tropomodulin [Oesophagostomum dentatum]
MCQGEKSTGNNIFSYYAEEKTFSAPSAKPAGRNPPISQAKLNGRGLKDLDDHDIDGLLSSLSIDELEDLNNDFDPDNSMLPPSQRCRDQTTKTPTGPFKRDHLLKYLEDQAKNEKDWEDVVPFSPGIKRGSFGICLCLFLYKVGSIFSGKVWEGDAEHEGQDGGDTRDSGVAGMEMPIELDLDDEEEEEYEAALDHAPERDLVDLAGILGMHNILNQPQYYNALKGKQQDDSTGTTFAGIIRAYEPKEMPDEPDNETDVDDCIKRLEEDDEDMKEVNINNMKRVSKERIRKLITAACASKHITKLSMANTAISDSEARGLIELIETSPSLKVLNIESNFITPELLAKLLRATLVTQCLTEFRAENQRQAVLGNQIEMDMMLSVEENQSLLRVGVAFQSMEARHRVSEALEKNYERVRLRRLGKTVDEDE